MLVSAMSEPRLGENFSRGIGVSGIGMAAGFIGAANGVDLGRFTQHIGKQPINNTRVDVPDILTARVCFRFVRRPKGPIVDMK